MKVQSIREIGQGRYRIQTNANLSNHSEHYRQSLLEKDAFLTDGFFTLRVDITPCAEDDHPEIGNAWVVIFPHPLHPEHLSRKWDLVFRAPVTK